MQLSKLLQILKCFKTVSKKFLIFLRKKFCNKAFMVPFEDIKKSKKKVFKKFQLILFNLGFN